MLTPPKIYVPATPFLIDEGFEYAVSGRKSIDYLRLPPMTAIGERLSLIDPPFGRLVVNPDAIIGSQPV